MQTANSNWREQRQRKAFLVLQDGTVFRGHSIGAPRDGVGEVVFNTGMTGYQEILSDPSYSGQFVTMTCPEIGNYGVNAGDMESGRMHAAGFIVHSLNTPSNWRSESSLQTALQKAGIPALAGIDTRALTTLLRQRGTQRGLICTSGQITESDAAQKAREWEGLDGQDYAARVTCAKPYAWDTADTISAHWDNSGTLPPADLNVVAYDFGIKWNILRNLRRSGMKITVVPAQTPAAEVMSLKPDGVFFSNGPADPAAVCYAIEAARELIGRVPVMGICLGHQILGIAVGGSTARLKFGHHGCNHPVKDLATGAVEITSQNHNFSVTPDSLRDAPLTVTHINLNDQTIEGFAHKTEPMFAVQYHPEAGPGPHDSTCIFQRFRELIIA